MGAYLWLKATEREVRISLLLGIFETTPPGIRIRCLKPFMAAGILAECRIFSPALSHFLCRRNSRGPRLDPARRSPEHVEQDIHRGFETLKRRTQTLVFAYCYYPAIVERAGTLSNIDDSLDWYVQVIGKPPKSLGAVPSVPCCFNSTLNDSDRAKTFRRCKYNTARRGMWSRYRSGPWQSDSLSSDTT